MMKVQIKRRWLIWMCLSAVLTGILFFGISFKPMLQGSLQSKVRLMFSPAAMSSGHAQIGAQCTSCHGDKPLAGGEAMQAACTNCHQREEGNKAADLHPIAKFEDPSNIGRLKMVAADKCVTCHAEHAPAAVHKTGFMMPLDTCVACHREVAHERPSHKDMKFTSCLNSGCHNYHDNKPLYEKFLLKNAGQATPTARLVKPRDFKEKAAELGVAENPHSAASWKNQECKTCHADEVKTFGQGKHGMRVAAGLEPMTPALSKMPFKPPAHDKALSCISCHEALQPDVRKAAVESCTSCHDDKHTQAYKGSPHELAWQKELKGQAPAGSGVSCATCHMPRINSPDESRTLVTHNQNAFLRPTTKQIRPVCMSCHTLEFSIDALSDTALVDSNFRGKPTKHVTSVDMMLMRERVPKPETPSKE